MTNYFEDLREFVQLKTNHKFLSFLLILVLLSFAGVPPLMGFFPKLLLFNFLLMNESFAFIFIIMFFSAINVFYYIRVIRFIMFSNVRVFGLFQIPYNFFFRLLFLFILFLLICISFYFNIFYIVICP
jgi:NADH-quinone oxidoreductase subunit N